MKEIKKKKAIIIGAGPAGLTAAYELIKRTDIQPIIYELSYQIGGLSRTVNYKGNRIDIGGHRFFSKSDKVTQWWQNIMPLHNQKKGDFEDDKVLLTRNRLSRIFYLRKFFNYPISLSFSTLYNLGFIRVIRIGFSYIKIKFFKVKNEKSLEDFFINRFGKVLYKTFFKDYTQKVWGIPCNKINASWGAQRVKGLSISSAIIHAIKSILCIKDKSINQKNVQTSLIDKFMYPKFGPGQIWEEVAKIVRESSGQIHLKHEVIGLKADNEKIVEVKVKDKESGNIFSVEADCVFSTMPVKDLIERFENPVEQSVKNVASGLLYRDFITVGLLVNKLKIKNKTKQKTFNNIIPDNWIYIQERDVKVGRLQIFNNWSPYMVKDSNKIWMGLEYFCNEGDQLWNKPDKEFIEFAIDELYKIGFIEDKNDVIDSVIIRMPKTYPAYFGTYNQFGKVRDFVDKYENLFLIGRNGMHRYNNMDHSMLTAMTAVDNIVKGKTCKDNIWNINVGEEYHEEKSK